MGKKTVKVLVKWWLVTINVLLKWCVERDHYDQSIVEMVARQIGNVDNAAIKLSGFQMNDFFGENDDFIAVKLFKKKRYNDSKTLSFIGRLKVPPPSLPPKKSDPVSAGWEDCLDT